MNVKPHHEHKKQVIQLFSPLLKSKYIDPCKLKLINALLCHVKIWLGNMNASKDWN